MNNNPWGVKLRKTGLNEMRLENERNENLSLASRQNELSGLKRTNNMKASIYEDRQGSLAADAMAGKQGRLFGQGGRKTRRRKGKSRRHKKRRHFSRRR